MENVTTLRRLRPLAPPAVVTVSATAPRKAAAAAKKPVPPKTPKPASKSVKNVTPVEKKVPAATVPAKRGRKKSASFVERVTNAGLAKTDTVVPKQAAPAKPPRKAKQAGAVESIIIVPAGTATPAAKKPAPVSKAKAPVSKATDFDQIVAGVFGPGRATTPLNAAEKRIVKAKLVQAKSEQVAAKGQPAKAGRKAKQAKPLDVITIVPAAPSVAKTYSQAVEVLRPKDKAATVLRDLGRTIRDEPIHYIYKHKIYFENDKLSFDVVAAWLRLRYTNKRAGHRYRVVSYPHLDGNKYVNYVLMETLADEDKVEMKIKGWLWTKMTVHRGERIKRRKLTSAQRKILDAKIEKVRVEYLDSLDGVESVENP